MKSNCVVFALRFWWRLHRKGLEPYLTFRQSRAKGAVSHMGVMVRRKDGRLTLVSFKPVDLVEKPGLSQLWFKGKITRGD